MSKACATCSVQLGPRNASGYCRKCFARANAARPGAGEKIAQGIMRRLAADPVFRDDLRRRARAASASPKAQAARKERWQREKVWEQGNRAARAPEVRAKAGKRTSDTRLSWCPAHLREDYRHLIYAKRVKADEARQMILDQHDAEMKRWRAEHGHTARQVAA